MADMDELFGKRDEQMENFKELNNIKYSETVTKLAEIREDITF